MSPEAWGLCRGKTSMLGRMANFGSDIGGEISFGGAAKDAKNCAEQ